MKSTWQLTGQIFMLEAGDLKTDAIFNRPKIKVAPETLYRAIDIELTNHCNAHCYYCPRELVTDMGFMAEADFKTIIDQVKDYPEKIIIGACGHGESLLHPHIGEFISYARNKSLPFELQTNGSLLTAEKRKTLISAGLTTLRLSVSAIGELHEKIYKLKFDPILKNIKAFIKEAQGSCRVGVYIVQTDLNKRLIRDYKTFWEDIGVDHCDVFPVINRSGSIPHKNLIYSDKLFFENSEDIYREHHFSGLCHHAIAGTFIGWDGNHYLCANDWEKKITIGHVSKLSLYDALAIKARALSDQTTSICHTCDCNIKNRIKDCLRQENSAEAISQLVESRRHEEKIMRELLLVQGLSIP